jgi:hypothetical protein
VFALTLASTVADAQLQRRTGGPGGGGGVELPNIPANPRYPFAGAWVGQLAMPGNEAIPIAMIIEATDGKYTGATVWPNGARAPHDNNKASGDVITWDQSNSGGGRWYYTMKRTAGDSLVGTMTLRDAPNFPPPMPTGTVRLIRNPAQAARSP